MLTISLASDTEVNFGLTERGNVKQSLIDVIIWDGMKNKNTVSVPFLNTE